MLFEKVVTSPSANRTFEARRILQFCRIRQLPLGHQMTKSLLGEPGINHIGGIAEKQKGLLLSVVPLFRTFPRPEFFSRDNNLHPVLIAILLLLSVEQSSMTIISLGLVF